MDQTDPPMLLPDHAPHDNRNYSIVLAENTLPTKGNELTDLAREEIGTDFILDTGKPAASRLQRFFLFLMLVLTLGMVYYYFPRPSVPVELKNEISFKDLAGSCEKRFEKTARAAQNDWEKVHYYACVEKLQPVIEEFIKAFAIGYRYAVSYASEAGFNRNIRLPNMPKLIPSSVTASFGVTVYFLLLLPFVSLFLIPGFFIGGTIMADREIP